MIHFLPDAEAAEPQSLADSEILARVAGLKRALRLVDPFGSGPADDFDGSDWAQASEDVRHCFDLRSERSIASAAAGLEAVVAERQRDREPGAASLTLLADEIRDALADLSSLVRGSPVSATPVPSPWG